MPKSSPIAAISTVSSSRIRHSTDPSMPSSPRRAATNARPTSPCSSSVIPSAMSSVSFDSVLRCGALSADGPAWSRVELSRSHRDVEAGRLHDTHTARRAGHRLRRLRRRRAERLVPVPVSPVPVSPPSGRRRSSPPSRRCPSDPARFEPPPRPEPLALAPLRWRLDHWPSAGRPGGPLGPSWRDPWPDRAGRRERSRRGRAPTGRTRARTRASTRTRPKRPVLGSLTTITSASLSGHAELVEGLFGRLVDGLPRHFNPLHALPSLSGALGA